MKTIALVLSLALGGTLALGAPALAQPTSFAPGQGDLTPTTYQVQLFPEQGGGSGEAALVRIENVDADTWRGWITYQGQTYVGAASPLNGGWSVFAVSGLVPEAARATPVRRGAAQRLTNEEPTPRPPSSGEGYQPGVPAMLLIRLESGGSRAEVTLRDARERVIGRGAGGVDWSAEADRLAERLEEARRDLDQTHHLDRTRRQELRVEDLAEQHRRVADQVTRAELASGDADQLEAAGERTLERVARLRERSAAQADPQSPAARALSAELRDAEALLRQAREARARRDAEELESRDLARVAPATARVRERLARLREAYAAEEDRQGPRAQLLGEELRDAESLLERALERRTAAEAAELESRDLERVSEGVDHVRERLARLREQHARLEPRSPSAELLGEDLRRTQSLLRHGVERRTQLEAAEAESGSPRRTAAVTDHVRERLAQLREDYAQLEPSSPSAEVLSEELRRTESLLRHATEQRTRAEVAGIESENPRTVARASAQVQGRLARLREQYAQLEPRSPSAEVLSADLRQTQSLLRHALDRRQRAEARAIESGDPARIEPVVSELEGRLNSAEVRLAQLPGLTPTHELLRQEQQRTSTLLRVAHERQLTRDEQDVRSENPARVEALKERLEARLAHLDVLANQWRPSGQGSPPRWLGEQRRATRDLLRRLEARER